MRSSDGLDLNTDLVLLTNLLVGLIGWGDITSGRYQALKDFSVVDLSGKTINVSKGDWMDVVGDKNGVKILRYDRAASRFELKNEQAVNCKWWPSLIGSVFLLACAIFLFYALVSFIEGLELQYTYKE